MPRSNIVFFTGANHIFLRRDLDAWVEILKKYGEYNISRLDRENILKTNIQAELLTPVFLGEKRLIILEDIPFATTKNDDEGERGEEITSKVLDPESIILSALDQIPETTIVLFVSTDPDKRKALYKKLHAEATLKEYDTLEGNALREYIRKKLPHIDVTALVRLIEYTHSDINRIESEIGKLALYKQGGWITEDDIKATVIPNIETSIFTLTDAIFVLDPSLAHKQLMAILEIHNIHYVFSTLVSTLRTFLYVSKLLSQKYQMNQIAPLLGIHPFRLEKMCENMRYSPQIEKLFSEFISLDRRTKTGEGIGDSDDALRLGLEKLILCLQKS